MPRHWQFGDLIVESINDGLDAALALGGPTPLDGLRRRAYRRLRRSCGSVSARKARGLLVATYSSQVTDNILYRVTISGETVRQQMLRTDLSKLAMLRHYYGGDSIVTHQLSAHAARRDDVWKPMRLPLARVPNHHDTRNLTCASRDCLANSDSFSANVDLASVAIKVD